ncbi:5764_t:CDS:2 [Ambispora leptoticha]|uniref:5764_t:CDS:1 n=1 Tax=Ambispora leptoticha TaxID=144679 RepID=A0A9N8V6H4_9GLOM|nr:5764_t:CDS:2 [Ambispora leptoticha]
MTAAWNHQYLLRPKIKEISTTLNELHDEYQCMPREDTLMSYEMNRNGSVNNHYNNNNDDDEHLMEITYDTSTLPSWREAVQLHDDKQYARAFPIFEEYAKGGDHVNEAKYLVGLYIYQNYDDKIPNDEQKAFTITNDYHIRQTIISGARPDPIPSDTPKTYIEIMTAAWDPQQSHRPKSMNIFNTLNRLHSQYKNISAAKALELHDKKMFDKAFPIFEECPKDLELAEKYLKEAKSLGHKDAMTRLKKLKHPQFND